MKREPKNLHEARALLVDVLPDGWTMWLECEFYDSVDPTHRYSTLEYSARLHRKDAGDENGWIRVRSNTPAKLARETLRKLFAYLECYSPHLLPASAPARRPAARKKAPRLSGATVPKLGVRRA